MENNIQDNIRWGQSWNLAVALVSENLSIDERGLVHDSEKIQKIVEYWQKYFYEQLKRKDVCNDCKGIDQTPRIFTCKECVKKQGYESREHKNK